LNPSKLLAFQISALARLGVGAIHESPLHGMLCLMRVEYNIKIKVFKINNFYSAK
jgi:hypothetical protein